MNAELLETFLDVFESRNFNRSSDRLGIAQSSVSARITSLEKSLHTRLFERGRQGATPTPAGVRFEEHARLILASWDHARRDVGAAPGVKSVLRLAGQFSLMRSVLVDWVINLREIHDDLAVDLQADYSKQIVRDLLGGTLDIGLLYSPRNLPDLVVQQEGIETFRMVSNMVTELQQVRIEEYIKTGYTRFFTRSHDELLPHLSSNLIAVGNEELSIELLNRIGGTSYLPTTLAKTLCNKASSFDYVQHAPVISQPIYSVVHVRRQYDPATVYALSILREVISTKKLNAVDP